MDAVLFLRVGGFITSPESHGTVPARFALVRIPMLPYGLPVLATLGNKLSRVMIICHLTGGSVANIFGSVATYLIKDQASQLGLGNRKLFN